MLRLTLVLVPLAILGAPAPADLGVTPLVLPGASGAVSLDYLASDRAHGRVWIPAGGTGSVDVLDVASGKLSRIEGFVTAEREAHGAKRVMGPSSVTLGDNVVYVGNRANSQVCVIDPTTLTRGACLTLESMPDGLQYVAATKEVWVTTPRDKSITVLDAKVARELKPKLKIPLPGEPEGYAVDDGRGLFFTNLEDGDKTLRLDVRSHRVTATWEPACGADGPRGLALTRELLVVACTDHVQVLDLGHDGARLGSAPTGGGVDNIDYVEGRGLVFAAAGRSATLSIFHLSDTGHLAKVASASTSAGARVVVADLQGKSYVGDPALGRLLVVAAPP